MKLLNKSILTGNLTILFVIFLIHVDSVGQQRVAWPLKVSENKRYLVDQHARPFFINGETAWKIMNYQRLEEMDDYLDNCKKNGINTVLFVFMPFQGETDAYGNEPFLENDLTRPNEKYWENVDALVSKADERDLLLLGVMLWHKDDQNGLDGSRRNPLKYSLEDCKALGKFLGSRYNPDKGRGNLIFTGGGDKSPREDGEKYVAMAQALLDENPRAIITYHAYHPNSSADEWGNPGWLSLNGIYNYQPPHSPEWVWQEAFNNWKDHHKKMPIILYEGLYENESRKGYEGTSSNIRKQQWWAVTSGCTAGHAIGNRYLWTMQDWKEHLEDEARMDMQHISALMSKVDWWKREPDIANKMLIGGHGKEAERATACVASDNSYAIIYSPNTEDPEVNLTLFDGPVSVSWFNPRNGEFRALPDVLSPVPGKAFARPDSQDWVLVITRK